MTRPEVILAPLIIAKALALLAIAREVKTQRVVHRWAIAYLDLETTVGARPFAQLDRSHAHKWRISIQTLESLSVILLLRKMRSASPLMQAAAAEMEPGDAAMENAYLAFSLAHQTALLIRILASR
jgi:hypothetical protein